mmetsp:Transcript_22756/g.58183  ORF Transcript_22756/g.58183 Transcript_22756/m.58183 type:complete len:672 (+) Transcript_22756:150-2165(+)|eukprot:CAMPEP_0183401632 /NCGR_PEP_ID=MMETSP0370-20130417/13381_1 /TAXON_ID=268820 /ORGANISM="Peridinium aciculiferum, Strain PAER-2" /LENGTH=671 /DNA_ID=CAMNT_0025583109 /DNA_START=80 /DNA_END=2095 /DNA_ORIENTATION=-
MSGFRDTFTKDDGKEGLLGYDDAAFLYFAGCVLLVAALPWTYQVAKNAIFGRNPSEKEFVTHKKTDRVCKSASMASGSSAEVAKSRFTRGFLIQVGVLAFMWLCLLIIIANVGGHQEMRRFDPFAILEVAADASAADIKKAYRKLSLVYHPDKNPDDPLAVSRFIEITRAYTSLTDETAKSNYEKYGNPDGPTTSKVGIGLPRFLLEKTNQLMILCIFFFFLLFVVPMAAIQYYQRTKDYASNGVLIETLHTFASYINDATRVKNCPELLAISGESRAMVMRPTDNEAMKPIGQQVVEHKKAEFAKWPIVMKNTYLVYAHMQRLHHLLTPELRQDLDQLLRCSMRISQAMIEIGCMREWFFTAQAMIDFRRSLVQALDIKASSLLQVPHFTEEHIKHCKTGKNPVSSLDTFLKKEPEDRKGMASLEPEQVLDIEAFCEHVSHMELRATVEVEDETEIVVGDIATVTVQMKRNNLKEGETVGPVHAPLFPEPKYEEWWVFLVEGSVSRIIAFERVRSTERFIEEKMRFQLSRPGKHRLELHILCDSYAGLDQKVVLEFNVCHEDDPAVKREIVVHKEDEDLDLQPTLFQQFMGDFGGEEESEEEEDDDDKDKDKDKEKKKKAPKAVVDKSLADGEDVGATEEPESDVEDTSKKGGKDKDKGGESSDSSSDSD